MLFFYYTNPFRFQIKILMDGFISHKKSSRHLMLGGGNGNPKKKEEEKRVKKKCQIWWLHWSSKIWSEDTKSWCRYYWKTWRGQPNLRIPSIVNPTYRWVLDDDKPNLISCQHIIQRNRGKRLCWSHYDGRKQKKIQSGRSYVESDLEKSRLVFAAL